MYEDFITWVLDTRRIDIHFCPPFLRDLDEDDKTMLRVTGV